jgi:hypothetical protein
MSPWRTTAEGKRSISRSVIPLDLLVDRTSRISTMAPPGSDKKRITTGLGLVTSVLTSPQNSPLTPTMGIGKFFGLSSSSNSNPNPPRPQSLPLSPGDSKSDYYYETSPSKSSFKKSSLQSYIPDVPPPPPPPYERDDKESARDSKSPASPEIYPYAVYRPEQILTSKKSNGEDPLLELKRFDITIILDDSLSMTIADNPGGRSRWDQVSNSRCGREWPAISP